MKNTQKVYVTFNLPPSHVFNSEVQAHHTD